MSWVQTAAITNRIGIRSQTLSVYIKQLHFLTLKDFIQTFFSIINKHFLPHLTLCFSLFLSETHTHTDTHVGAWTRMHIHSHPYPYPHSHTHTSLSLSVSNTRKVTRRLIIDLVKVLFKVLKPRRIVWSHIFKNSQQFWTLGRIGSQTVNRRGSK